MSARKLSPVMIRARAKSLAALAISLVFAVAALPALAQQEPAAPKVPAPPYGYDYMIQGGPWGWHAGGPAWGWHPFIVLFGAILVLLAIIGAMAVFVWLVRWATHGYPFYGHGAHHFHGGCPCCGGHARAAALEILDERLAKGEIDKAEYEEKRKLLAGKSG